MNFAKLEINEHLKNSISCLFENGSFPHAVFLTGGNAKQRKALAKHLAMAYVCLSDKDKPCLKCTQCQKVKNGNHPDVTEIEKDEKKSNISIDTIKELKRKSCILPNDADTSVFIIHEASDLKEDSQNSLLKILEEPPAYVRFILTSANREDLITTVLSRVTHFPLSEQTEEKENAKGVQTAQNVLKAIAERNEYNLILCTAGLTKDKNAIKSCFDKLIFYLRNSLLIKNGVTVNTDTPYEQKIADTFETGKIIEMIETVDKLSDNQLKNANENVLLACFSMETAKSF